MADMYGMESLCVEERTQSPKANNSTPPMSGPHLGNLARWGIPTEPIRDESMVHNLEDGGVGIWYDSTAIDRFDEFDEERVE